MSKRAPEPTALDDKDLEQATGGLVSAVVTYKALPAAQARALNFQGGGATGGYLDTGVEYDPDDPGLL